MTSQPTIGERRKFRCRVQEIQLEPTTSKYDIVIELQVDGARIHKLTPIKKGQLLHRTDLCIPCDVHEDSTITLLITEVHRIQDHADRAVCQMLPLIGKGGASINQNLVSIGCENGMFRTQVTFLDKDMAKQAYSEALNKVQLMEKQQGVLETAGRVGHAFKALLGLGGMMADLDPTGSAKVVFAACTKAWEHLEQQDKEDAELHELVKSLARMIPSVESVKNIANGNLRETVMNMLDLIEDVSFFILNARPRNSLERALRAMVSSEVQERAQAFIIEFRDLRAEFDTRVGVQTLQTVESNSQSSLYATLQRLNPVELVGYDPSRRCLAGTRTIIVGELTAWALTQDLGPRLAWVHGLAGFGKSSIATSVCERLDGQDALACSVFCKRDSPDLRDLRRVLMTIVYDLALKWEAYGAAVAAVVHEDPKLNSKFPTQLYDALLKNPLKSLGEAMRPKDTLTLIVDALDEFGDVTSRKQLLECLRDLSQRRPWLKVVVTSRPEADIQVFFGTTNPDWFLEYDVRKYDASDDIRSYLEDKLGGMKTIQNWPKDAITRLSIRSGGLFIWARTACEFIAKGYNECERLELVLAGSRLADIDTLYTTAIKASVRDDSADNMEYMLKCLGAVVVTATRAPLSAANLAMLLQGQVAPGVVERVLGSLSSVLYVDEKLGNVVRISHPSFMDYITTPSRSQSLCVDLKQHNTLLAQCCFQVMAGNLRFNLCGLESSDVFNCDVPNLDTRVRDTIHPHLSYSCLYWSNHVAEAELGTLDGPLRTFLFGPKLMHWLEVLSLLGKLGAAPACLLELMACCPSDRMQDCSILANDAYRFVLAFYDVISSSTPHLYISALAFAPEKSEISRRMRTFFPRLLAVTQGTEKEWTRCLRRIEVSSGVLCVAFSPNSRRIVSGSDDGTVRIWDAETGDPVLEPLKGHTRGVNSVAFSPNGRWIASGSDDETIRLWDAETGEARLGPLLGHSGWVWSVAFSLDGRRIVSGSSDRTVHIWDAETGDPALEPLEGHTDSVYSVTFSPNSQWIVSGSSDCTLRIWDAQTGAAVREPLEGHSGGVRSVAFSLDSRHVASCSSDTTVRIWDVETGKEVFHPLRGYSDWARCIAFSPNSKYLVSGSYDRTIRVWDTQTGDLVLDTLDGHSDLVLSVAFSANGRRVVSGSWDKTIRIWDVVDKGNPGAVKDSITSKGHSGFVYSVGFSSNGRYVVSGSDDQTVRIWDAETGAAVRAPFEGHSGDVLSVAFSPDDHLVVSGSRDKTVRIWNAETGELVLEPLRGHSGTVLSVAFSPNGHRVASGSADKSICVWNAETGAQALSPLTDHSGEVNSVAFSPNGHRLASGSDDHTVRIWDTETGQLALEPLTGHSHYVMSVAFSGDGRRIVSGSFDNTVLIWDAETGGAVLDLLRGHTHWVQPVAFSSDGRWIASGSDDNTVRIWDARTDEAVLEPMRGHSGIVVSVAFSPDGRRIASGSADMTVRIWDAESHTTSAVHTLTFLPGTQVRALPSQVTDGKLLVSSAELARHLHPDLAGWVTSSEGKLLVWLPPELRDIDDSLVCISGSRVRHQGFIDFSAFVHGSSWASIADV
ncbi:hypothetical protein FS749_003521 [Ceratobasidium sp. UAMH 11750]|nr:hypothetical protein FS749_003521 [Ceratobasidium sp. UAMH 11750]